MAYFGYLNLFYGNYLKYNNINTVKDFIKQSSIKNQIASFNTDIDATINKLGVGSERSLLEFLISTSSSLGEIDSTNILTTSRTLSEVQKPGGGSYARTPSLGTITPFQIVNNWEIYSKEIKKFIDDIELILRRVAPNIAPILSKLAADGKIRGAALSSKISKILSMNQIVGIEREDVYNLIISLRELNQSYQTMMTANQEHKTKDVATDIKKATNKAIRRISGEFEEVINVWAYNNAEQEIMGKIIQAEKVGNVLKEPGEGDSQLYQDWKKAHDIVNTLKGTKIKTDARITIGEKQAVGEFGLSIKTVNFDSYGTKYYGVSVVDSTPFLKLIDNSVGFGSEVFEQLINIGAGSTKTQIGNLRVSDDAPLISEGTASKIWQDTKNAILRANISQILMGDKQIVAGVRNMAYYLVINRKFYRMDEILLKIKNEQGTFKVNGIPYQQFLSSRQDMVYFNEQSVMNKETPDMNIAVYRSKVARDAVIQYWQDIKIQAGLANLDPRI